MAPQFILLVLLTLVPEFALAIEPGLAARSEVALLGVPLEFLLFALTLFGIALFHRYNFVIALGGLIVILAYKLLFSDLELSAHLAQEWHLLLNLFGLLLGLAILAKHFADSGVPDLLPRWLPDNWIGGFVLLVLIAVLSSFLDNIAAAVIGGVIARKVYCGRVSVGYLAAIVAASNAGGAGSVIGDTTTTMMWIAGVPALAVAPAFVGAAVAVAFSGFIASRAQQRIQAIQKDSLSAHGLKHAQLYIVGLIIIGFIATNMLLNFPAVGAWAGILLGGLILPIPWGELRKAYKGALFLLALVLSASLMPVSALPVPSWETAFGLGWASAVFDNIPLTALALKQGGYDWGILAYAVGYGGSMIWFGSSAGVAITADFPEAKDTRRWLKEGWHVAVAYVLGFFVMLWLMGWTPLVITPTS